MFSFQQSCDRLNLYELVNSRVSYFFKTSRWIAKITCKMNINLSEKTYHYVACDCHILLTPICTGLTQVAVNGIVEHGMNVMLILSSFRYWKWRYSGNIAKNVRKLENFWLRYQQKTKTENSWHCFCQPVVLCICET